MATVINNPPSANQPVSTDGGSGMGMVIGIIVAVLVVFLFIVYGLPALRGGSNNNTPPSQAPAAAPAAPSGGTNINVPDKIDVNVKK